MPVPCFVANWKMNKTVEEAQTFLAELSSRLEDSDERAEVVIAPPYTALTAVAAGLSRPNAGGACLGFLAAQNVCENGDGAYTGEISARMLAEVGCRFVIVGHSERRVHAGETDEQIVRKIAVASEWGIAPILCVGETMEARRDGQSFQVVERQIRAASLVLPAGSVIAYEPVWAIGTGVIPRLDEIDTLHQHLRGLLGGLPAETGLRLLYGGSVNRENVASVMSLPSVDGVLVGGASLSASTFVELIALGIQAKYGG